MSLSNYHTHTARCHHAEGTDEAYVRAALEAGYSDLGFSDHCPFPYRTGFVSRIRMLPEALSGYVHSMQHLADRYRGQIRLHAGLEAEYFPRYLDYLKSLADQGIDYLILGQHFLDSDEDSPYVGNDSMTDDGVLRYAEKVCTAMQTGLYTYLAHPDLFMRYREENFTHACEQAADMICQCAMETGTPLEYNVLGLHLQLDGKACGYPSSAFWHYCTRYPVQTIIGIDAHAPSQLTDLHVRQEAEKRMAALGYHPLLSLPLPEK